MNISDILNSTTPSVMQIIIINLIVDLIGGVILAIILGVPSFVKTKITKLLNPHPEETERRKQLEYRIKTKSTTQNDIDYVMSLKSRNFRLNHYEKEFYKAEAPAYTIHLLDMLRRALEARDERQEQKSDTDK